MVIASISHHDMTTKEFKGFTKKSHTFAAWRQVSKTINFGVLFGCTAPTLAVQLENAGYTEKEAMTYIKNTHNEQLFNNLCREKKGTPQSKVAFLTAANLMLETYYKSYPGVKERSEREIRFAWKHGYTRNWHGTVRHLPEMRFMVRNSNGEVAGADRKLYSSRVSNMQNQAGNSPIQAMEANTAINTIARVWEYLDEWHLRSFMWNMVHDSQDWCVWKPEAELIASLVDACSTWHRQPEFGVFMKMDFAFADLSKGRENNLYHGGVENPWKFRPIEEVVKDWNESHKDIPGFEPIHWHGCKN